MSSIGKKWKFDITVVEPWIRMPILQGALCRKGIPRSILKYYAWLFWEESVDNHKNFLNFTSGHSTSSLKFNQQMFLIFGWFVWFLCYPFLDGNMPLGKEHGGWENGRRFWHSRLSPLYPISECLGSVPPPLTTKLNANAHHERQ